MKRILSVLSLLIFSSAAIWGQANAMGGDDTAASRQAPTALTKHTLKGTYISVGVGPAVGAGFTPIDAANNVVCPGTSGNCLIQADQVIQVGATSATNNSVALCFYVDGVSVDGCPYNGDTLVNGHYTSFSYSHGVSVPHGNHSVQTVLYTAAGANSANYTFTYNVYKP